MNLYSTMENYPLTAGDNLKKQIETLACHNLTLLKIASI